jgi:hypothetical protein
MTVVAKILCWPIEESYCWMCRTAPETQEHFLAECPVLYPCRTRFRSQLQLAIGKAGDPGKLALDQYDAGGVSRVRLMLEGVQLNSSVIDLLETDPALRERVGYVQWCVDKITKNYLVIIWRVREALVGRVRVHSRQIIVLSSVSSARALLARQVAADESKLTWDRANRWRRQWLVWAPRPARKWQSSRVNRRRFPFYVVWRGRSTGVFYLWSDCWQSVAGVEDAGFCGARDLASAYEMLAEMLSVGSQELIN